MDNLDRRYKDPLQTACSLGRLLDHSLDPRHNYLPNILYNLDRHHMGRNCQSDGSLDHLSMGLVRVASHPYLKVYFRTMGAVDKNDRNNQDPTYKDRHLKLQQGLECSSLPR